jgi:hypothetical protein
MIMRASAAVLSAVLLAALVSCTAQAPRAAKLDQVPPPDAQQAADSSYDWHALLIAPFGSSLKDIPLTLHEVLLFRDEAHGTTAADDAECYGADVAAPRFIGRTPDEYLLCFTRDRLSRIQASVRLAPEQAVEVFTAACAIWLKNAASAPGAAPTPAPTPPPAAEVQSGGACEGRDGAIHFGGRFEEEAVLSITLDSVPEP